MQDAHLKPFHVQNQTLTRRFTGHDQDQSLSVMPEGTNKSRIRNRLLTTWLQQKNYRTSRLSLPFRWGYARDTEYLPLFLLSCTEDEPSMTTERLLADVSGPQEQKEFKCEVETVWMPGMCFEGSAKCNHRSDTVFMPCILDCSDFVKAVDQSLPQRPVKASLTAAVATAFQRTLQKHMHNTGNACTSCKFHLCLFLKPCSLHALNLASSSIN